MNMASSCQRILPPRGDAYLDRNEHLTHVNFACVGKMYDYKLFCDVTLVADDEEVQAHKLILASCSTYFYWKFSKGRIPGTGSH